jgi:hypothetical protein
MTRSRLLVRSLILGLVLVGPALATSCGGSSKEPAPAPASGGSSGGGGEAPVPMPIQCGAETCDPFDVPDILMQPDIPACCATGDRCGLDSSILENYGLAFGDVCQPRNQPGEENPDCPASSPLMLPGTMTSLGTLKGCCRTESHTCGYLLVIAGLVDTGLGCVDSTPFLEGGTAPDCSPAGGAGSN